MTTISESTRAAKSDKPRKAPDLPVKIRQTKILIDGKWVNSASGKTFETINPCNGELLANVQEGDKADVDKAVAAARRASKKDPGGRK